MEDTKLQEFLAQFWAANPKADWLYIKGTYYFRPQPLPDTSKRGPAGFKYTSAEG